MKRTKTKLLSVFLSVCMVFTCMIGLSATASATSYDPYTVFSGLVQSIKQGDTINGSWRDEEGMYANGELVTIKPAGGGADIATRAVNWTAAADYNITACDYTVYDSYDGNLGPYEDQYGDYMEVLIYEFIFTVESAAPATVAVTGVTLAPTTATLTAGGDPVTLTATVAPADATDKKVKWSVNGSAVTLYSDANCTAGNEIGTNATETLTVYAKGVSAGIATVTATSNANNTISATCAVVVNSTPAQPPVAVSPNADAGSVSMEYDSEENAWACTAVPATGYKFVKWTFVYNGSSGEAPSNSIMLNGMYIDSFTNITAVFEEDTPAQPTVAVSPNADAGSVSMEYDSENGYWVCTPVPATGYKFVKWTVFNNDLQKTFENTSSTFYYVTDWYSNLTAVFELDTPLVTILPDADAGSITYNYNQQSSQWELTAVPATGYKFVQWAYFEGEGHAPEPSTSTDVTLIVTDDMKNLTAYFEAVTEPDEIDISEGTVTVDVSSQSVTVTVDGQIVPASEYHVIFFTYEEIDGGESVERVGTEFPTAEGTYIAAVIANDDSELYTGENRSKPFTVSGYKPDPTPTPVPRPTGIIHIPTYTGNPDGSSTAALPSSPETAVAPAPVKDVGGVKDVTNTDENVGGAFINEDLADLVDAVLDEKTKAAIANGETVYIYLTVEEAESDPVAAALAEKLGYTIGKFLDISLYVKNGDNITPVGETGMIKVSIELPEELKNTDPDVLRRFAVLRIHNGEVQILTTDYDPETNILSFLTDKFSSYIIAFIDEAIAEPDPDTVIGDEDDDDTEEVEVDADTDKAEDAPAVVDAGETNPHTGVTADAFALVLLAGAVMFVSRKRK